MKKNFLKIVLTVTFLLSACEGNTFQPTPTAIPVIDDPTSTPSPFPTATRTENPTTTLTASITPLPTIPTFTPTAHPLSISTRNFQSLQLTKKISLQNRTTTDGITEISTFSNPVEKVDQFLIAIGYESGLVQLIKSDNLEIIHEYKSEPWPNGIAFSPDGRMLAVAYEGFEIRVWNNSTGELIKALAYPDSNVENVIFSNDGKNLIGQSKTGNIRIWDAESWRLLDQDSGLFLSSYPPDKTPIALSYLSKGERKFINPLLKSVLFTLPQGPQDMLPIGDYYETRAIAYSYDEKYLAEGSGYGWIAIWDIENRRLVSILSGHESLSHDGPPNGIYDLAFSPYGSLLASTGIDGTIRLWDIKSGKNIWNVDLGRSISNLAFSPDGHYLIVGDFKGNIYLWSIDQ